LPGKETKDRERGWGEWKAGEREKKKKKKVRKGEEKNLQHLSTIPPPHSHPIYSSPHLVPSNTQPLPCFPLRDGQVAGEDRVCRGGDEEEGDSLTTVGREHRGEAGAHGEEGGVKIVTCKYSK
jgi:hypothetical protein